MISIKTDEEIKLIKESGKINSDLHKLIEKSIKPGVKTNELNEIAKAFLKNKGAESSFLNYNGFPKEICVSINDEVVHGIPGDREIKAGDIVSIDIGVKYKGYHSDSAKTHIVEEASENTTRLVQETKEALYKAISKLKEGEALNIIGYTIENHVTKKGFSVIRELVGHGVGKNLHEAPDVPNYKNKDKTVLKRGMTLAIEPMINEGKRHIYIADDGWTIKTEDSKASAHFEHTVLITKDGCEILTGE